MARGFRAASRVGVVLALCLTLAAALAAQVAPPVLTLDLDSARVIGGRIPFDQQFELLGKAPKELVQVTLLIRPASVFSQDSCSRPARSGETNYPAPPDAVTWTRNDNRTVFSLRAGPIEAEASYTLCVRTVLKLTDSADASIRREAAARVADTIRSHFSKSIEPPISPADLERLRGALIGAFSGIDLGYSRAASGPYLKYEQEQLRSWITADTGQGFPGLYAALWQAYSNESTSIEYISSHVQRLDTLLNSLAANLRAARLDRVALEREPTTPQAHRMLMAAAIARSLPGYGIEELGRIAWGATPFAAPDGNAPRAPPADAVAWKRRRGADLAAPRARLDTMDVQLRSLVDLAYLAGLPPNAESLGLRKVKAILDSTRIQLLVVRNGAQRLADAVDLTNDAAARLVPAISTFSVAQIGVPGSSATTYVESAKDYISADVGLLWGMGFWTAFAGGAVQPYVGANFYFTPVNRNARYDCGSTPLKCVSLTVGLTTGSIARPSVRTNLIGSHSLFVGLGVRWSSYIRCAIGSLIFQSYSNDSRRAQRITGTLALALSADWDIRSTFGGLGELLGGK